jgi:HTH-type transcriptional regulator/antitoxin HigA
VLANLFGVTQHRSPNHNSRDRTHPVRITFGKSKALDAMKPVAEQDYQQLVELLDRLTDEVGEDENHPLASLMDVLGVLIEKYEDEHVPELAE